MMLIAQIVREIDFVRPVDVGKNIIGLFDR
jgi:hypothetical protein